jgi:Repeat of unknown function (DUF6923)
MSHRVPYRLPFPAAVAICLAAALAAPAVLPAQGPFACTGEAYIVQDSAVAGIDGQLTQIDQSQSPFVFIDVGTAQAEYNNIGFNPADGFIYGVELTTLGNNGLIRIADDGTVTHLSAVSGMCAGATISFPSNVRFDAGDVSANGQFLFVNQTGNNRLYIIDISASPPVLVDCPTINPNPPGGTNRVNDWAFNEVDGNLYGGDRDGGQVARLDLAGYTPGGANITRTDFNVTGASFAGTAFGGAWFDALGHLFLYRNDGRIYEIVDVTGAAPTMTIVATQTGPGSTRNDGAACAQNVVGAAKSMSTNNPGGLPATITITYVFENFDGATPLMSLSAIDDLSAVFGTHPTDWMFLNAMSTPMGLVNPAFNGHSVTELINAGQTLAAGASGTITVHLMLLAPGGDTNMDEIYCNQVILTGDLGGAMYGDTSTDGSDPDPDGDGVPVERSPSCIMQVPVELQSFSID